MNPSNNFANVPRSIPDRWMSYKPHGTVIEGTNILAFKVPLKEAISKNLPPEERFTPEALMQQFPNLRYIIDLTNTARYYQPKDFEDAGINHIKIMIPGKVVPPLDCVKKFFKAMDTFSSSAKNNELIGVHCTHGINRTGYLVCRYLVQQLGWEPQNSVKAFEKARGYPIERGAYMMEIIRTPRVKCDISSVKLNETNRPSNEFSRHNPRRPPMRQGPMASNFAQRRGFTIGRPYGPPPSRQPFGYGGPPHAFGPRPSIPQPLPPPTGRLYGPRPHAYGMPPMRPPLPPPGPGPFPGARFPPMMPGPPRIQGPPRLPHSPVGPPSRLSGPGMPPPRLPPPGVIPSRLPPPHMAPPHMAPPHMAPPRHPMQGRPSPRLANFRRSLDHLRREAQGHGAQSQMVRGPGAPHNRGETPKIPKDMDFTLDTFDENLAASVCP